MGEAKAKRARLASVLGETRGEHYSEFLDDLRNLDPKTPSEHDRVCFMRLMATAVVEGLNARTSERDDATRCLQVFDELAYIAGTQIGSQVMKLIREDIPDPAEAAVFLANRMNVCFANGVAIALQHSPAPVVHQGDGDADA